MTDNVDRKCPHFAIHLPTVAGKFIAYYSENGLAGLAFPARKKQRVLSSPQKIPTQILRWHRVTGEALKRILAGRPTRNLPPLDWSGGTEFQKAVWAELLKIPFGQTRSYGEIARRMGRPRAVRAVGSACGANPVPVLVPCHRVLAANNKLGGFSSGLNWKRDLLQREGTNFHSVE